MIEKLFTESNWWQIYLATVAYFTIIYFGFGQAGAYLSRKFLPKHHIGYMQSDNENYRTQIKKEIRYSVISILVFGLFGVIPKIFYAYGFVDINWSFNWKTLPFELIFIFIWNDFHFYCCHRLLHKKWFFKHVHIVHHHSHIPTPFSTYSFHWFEAFLLSTVMILPMFFYTFSYITLLFLPVMSLFLNVLGHWNYALFPNRKSLLLKFSEHHSLHHSRVKGNFGFFLPYFDKIFHTELENPVTKK